jgi:GNAT superfamily N-acetyltransferase
MSGCDHKSRFAAEAAAQRAEGWSLRDRLLWRVSQLTNGQTIDLAEHATDFPELLAGFRAESIEPSLISHDAGPSAKLASKASLEDGGSFLLVGALHTPDGGYVGAFQRRLQLEPAWAVHELLVIDPAYRGRGIGPRLLLSSFALYDELEIEEVHLVAGLETGRWYWAHMGFDFLKGGDREMVQAWAREVCEALDVKPQSLGADSSAGQIARLRSDRDVTLEELAAAMPDQRPRLETDVAEKNGFAMDRPIPLGQAIMLTGPQWRAYLQLQGPQRLAFEEAALERTSRPSATLPLLEPAGDGSAR